MPAACHRAVVVVTDAQAEECVLGADFIAFLRLKSMGAPVRFDEMTKRVKAAEGVLLVERDASDSAFGPHLLFRLNF